MTALQQFRGTIRDWLRRNEAGRRLAFAMFVLLGLLLVPLVGHGCHGDDVDHEPAAAPKEIK